MTTNNTGKRKILEEILEAVRTIDDNVETVLDRLEEFGNGYDQAAWHGSDHYDNSHEY